MGLFSWLKRADAPPADLRSHLIALTKRDVAGLARAVRQHRPTIVAEFREWMTVPGSMQEDPSLLERYGAMLVAVARIIERDGDASLVQLLEGDPANSPVELWNEQIAVAATLSEQGRFVDAVKILSALAAQMEPLRGSAVDFYRPRVLGKLGIARYQSGDHAGAIDVTRQARDICQRLGDEDGVAAYSASLHNMGATD